jgi:hypothetical protein
MAPPPLAEASPAPVLKLVSLPPQEREGEGEGGSGTGLERSGLQLHQELAAVQNELDALQDMLEELPAILERKFQRGLHQVLEAQRQLIASNEASRQRLQTLSAATAGESRRQGLAPWPQLQLPWRRADQSRVGRPHT